MDGYVPDRTDQDQVGRIKFEVKDSIAFSESC